MLDGLEPVHVVAAVILLAGFVAAALTENKYYLFIGIGLAVFIGFAGGYL